MHQSTDIFDPSSWGNKGSSKKKKSSKKNPMVIEIPREKPMKMEMPIKGARNDLFNIGKVDFGKMSISEFKRPEIGSKNSLAFTKPKMTIEPVRFSNPKTNKKYGKEEALEVHEDVEEAFESGMDIDESRIKIFNGKRYYPMDDDEE